MKFENNFLQKNIPNTNHIAKDHNSATKRYIWLHQTEQIRTNLGEYNGEEVFTLNSFEIFPLTSNLMKNNGEKLVNEKCFLVVFQNKMNQIGHSMKTQNCFRYLKILMPSAKSAPIIVQLSPLIIHDLRTKLDIWLNRTEKLELIEKNMMKNICFISFSEIYSVISNSNKNSWV